MVRGSHDEKNLNTLIEMINANAAEDVAENNAISLDMVKLRKEIGETKGVGESRMNEIMAVIEKQLHKGAKNGNSRVS